MTFSAVKLQPLYIKVRNAGTYSIQWDATNISSGIYFYRLETNTGFVKTKKLLVLK